MPLQNKQNKTKGNHKIHHECRQNRLKIKKSRMGWKLWIRDCLVNAEFVPTTNSRTIQNILQCLQSTGSPPLKRCHKGNNSDNLDLIRDQGLPGGSGDRTSGSGERTGGREACVEECTSMYWPYIEHCIAMWLQLKKKKKRTYKNRKQWRIKDLEWSNA